MQKYRPAQGLGDGKGGRYTISQLARAAGVPTTTVRYYERVGLVQPEERSAGNYRLYSNASLERLRFIRAAQAIGFTLDDVHSLLTAPDASDRACQKVQTLIEARLADIAERLKDLQHVQQVLRTALSRCRAREGSGVCHVLETLQQPKHDSSSRR